MENKESNTSKIYVPLSPPDFSSEVIKRPSPLNGDEETKRLEVFNHFTKEDYKIPGTTENAELMEVEKFWLTNDCMLRFLRASKWNVTAAIKRLEETLKWRREWGWYDLITPEYVEPEAKTGKEVIFGFDSGGRPGFYMFPSRQNTEESIRQAHYAIWMLERALDMTPPGVETISLFINYGDKSKSPSISMSRNILHILQTYYPERLGRAYIINIPWLLNAFFKIIMPLVDPVTREKVKFNPKVVEEGHITAEQLMAAGGWGGAVDFEYHHDKYWPALLEETKKRREEQMQRWRAMGGKVGSDEWILKGGEKAEGETTPENLENGALVNGTPANGKPAHEDPVKEARDEGLVANGEPVKDAPIEKVADDSAKRDTASIVTEVPVPVESV